MNETLLTVFVGLTALAILIQMAVLIALYVSSKKTRESVQLVTRELEQTVLPLFRDLRTLVSESGPKLREAIDNLTATSATVRQESDRLGQAANDVADRVRRQAERVDQMLTRTLDRVEHTRETVQHAIRSPVQRFSGVLTAVAAGLAELRGNRKIQRQKSAVPRDEMFI